MREMLYTIVFYIFCGTLCAIKLHYTAMYCVFK